MTRTAMTQHHPDPVIDMEVQADARAAEQADVAAGYPPRAWTCPACRASHARGHFLAVGVHRCLACGYLGGGGTLAAPGGES